ncbi:S24 family peptidase [Sphingobacterium corticibacter]|uniref:Peptidase S24/S26A/S26B/S26C domain-containing protein n=1 Tax=Sphingobacterium corticibacter TaxID=2171749 RepID=A0A2T8HNG7_9SPHI|nr:hypothetical protein [Sphingobacterium corticibacter]PVH26971.1 hypothetical protein DC487_05090 [Sphingobacterium corticibacter]
MIHKGQYVKGLMKKLGVKQDNLTDKSDPMFVGFGKNTIINLLKKEDYVKSEDIAKINAILDAIGATKEDISRVFEYSAKATAKPIAEIAHPQIEQGLKEISPGYYLLTAELIPIHAQAGYLLGYQDREYIDTLPLYTTTVDKFVTGTYKYFEASGDSMDNGDIREAIPDGTVMLCREVARQYWQSKLHTHSWPNFVFVHRQEGIVVKQVASQDLETGTLLLRSLNPDKDKYPDYEVKMDDLLQIYNVVKRVLE